MTRPVALVTGASLGIGEQFARLLAERGNDLVLVARDRARLEALAKELEAKHGNHCEVLTADLIESADLARVEARAKDVDTLVNNAGFGSFGNFHELDLDTEDREIRLNVLAVVRLTHAAAGGMVARGRGGDPEHRVARRLPADAERRDLRGYEGLRAVVHAGGARGAEGHGCRGVGARTRIHEDRVPSAASFDPKSVPSFLWQEAEPVARAGLDGLAKNKAVIVPGAMNRIAAGLSSVAPSR